MHKQKCNEFNLVHMPPFLIYYDNLEMSGTTKINSSANLLLLFSAPTKVAWQHVTYIMEWAKPYSLCRLSDPESPVDDHYGPAHSNP
jgi:hypothetical protein